MFFSFIILSFVLLIVARLYIAQEVLSFALSSLILKTHKGLLVRDIHFSVFCEMYSECFLGFNVIRFKVFAKI